MVARYLVVFPPGAQVEGVGFVKAGQSFEAPRKDYVPSRKFRAMNNDAVDGLRFLQALLLEEAEKYADRLKEKGLTHEDIRAYTQSRDRYKLEAAEINFEVYEAAVEKENIRTETSLHELSEAALEADKKMQRAADGE